MSIKIFFSQNNNLKVLILFKHKCQNNVRTVIMKFFTFFLHFFFQEFFLANDLINSCHTRNFCSLNCIIYDYFQHYFSHYCEIKMLYSKLNPRVFFFKNSSRSLIRSLNKFFYFNIMEWAFTFHYKSTSVRFRFTNSTDVLMWKFSCYRE